MSKKVMVSTASVHVRNILDTHKVTGVVYDGEDKFINKFTPGSVIFDESIFTDEVMKVLPKEYIEILDIPEDYLVLSDNAIHGDEQQGLMIVKDMIYINTSSDILLDEEREKINEFIIPYKIEKK